MGFEIAGESFPGSAFYYLEDTPVPAPDAARFRPTRASAGGEAGLAAPGAADTPLAPLMSVAPLRMAGTALDRVRAQECLAMAVYYEAASESDAGQRAVAQVVLNRVAHPAWPSNVCGVVFQGSNRATGCQFTFTCDGSLARGRARAAWARASRVAREALAGAVYAPVGTSTHYHTLAVHPYWAPSLQRTAVIGAHIFYRWPGAAGFAAAFTGRYGGAEPVPGRDANYGPAPDPLHAPVAAPAITDRGSGGFEPGTGAPAAAIAPAPAEERAGAQPDNLPAGGTVRAQYANSGRWKDRP
ncbi:cell wall hydrolase [Aurantiacibacter spongiae]|uniref:Cell wall hydrolase n=2 Tax=Aurantiacibacter spongiae TaxID=2488860 RepID=A0A3N5CV64_9SPHN|nr:cell wall hydrolase [Aurantiacibacter spongiae]